MSDWHRLGIGALHAAFRAGAVTPSAALTAQLARIDQVDPQLRAFVDLDRSGAMAAARESNARVASGTLRPLEGVPVAVKSNVAVAGLGWNAGMALRRNIVAAGDAEAVARLRAAGAIVLGTLNMHEAALGATTDNVWFGRTANPHGTGNTPGGSSGGSGAAVAAGLCVASLGTDTLGSVRIPAAYNGVYGLKPTPGAIPADGLVALAQAFDAIGPLARSLNDLETMWRALATPTPHQPLSRLLLLDAFGGVTCDPAVITAYCHAEASLEALPSEPLTLPPLGDIRMAGFVAATRELSGALAAERREAAEQLSPGLHWLLNFADRAQPDPVLLDTAGHALRAAIGTDGVLLLPTAPQAAFPHGVRAPANQADFTGLANIAGLPALSIPAGRDERGMPVAVQIVGPAGSETALFALARSLDQALAGYAPPANF